MITHSLQERLEELDSGTLRSLPWMFEFWAHPHQLPPSEDYYVWVLTGGRGAGKTRAGAEWVRSLVEGARAEDAGLCRRIALIGQNMHEVREVMIFGESGIMNCSPPDRRPNWNSTRQCLEWPNGALGFVYSAFSPEALRGPQFDAAWLDEFAKWRRAKEVWDMLQFGMRLGEAPKILLTTTPRPRPILREILSMERTVHSFAPTYANQENLPPSFFDMLKLRYEGTLLGRQEIEGEFVENLPNALWNGDEFHYEDFDVEKLDRVILAIDPSVSGRAGSDEIGMVVAGARYFDEDPKNWRAYILDDVSMKATAPEQWAALAIACYQNLGLNQIVAEVNQGGDLIEANLRYQDPFVNFLPLFASKSKGARAENVAALYRQGRVIHKERFGELEKQLCKMTALGYEGSGSPDRADALIWALHQLMIEPLKGLRPHQLRSL